MPADELVLDGYLLPAPLTEHGAASKSIPGYESVMTPAEMGRQLLLGSSGPRPARRSKRIGAASAGARRSRRRRSWRSTSSGSTASRSSTCRWLERKRLLEASCVDGELVRRTVSVRPPVEAWYAQWRALGFREMAVKGANSRYTPGAPHPDWTTAPSRSAEPASGSDRHRPAARQAGCTAWGLSELIGQKGNLVMARFPRRLTSATAAADGTVDACPIRC